MTCDRCHKEITLGQWADDWCPVRRLFFSQPKMRHTVVGNHPISGEQRIREAFQQDQIEAAYARTQP